MSLTDFDSILRDIRRLSGLSEYSLKEGRDAPLYHLAGRAKSKIVFEKDILLGNWDHDLRAFFGKEIRGISLTRNPNLYIGGKDYMFVIDQTKVAQTNKIIPLDAEYAFHHGKNKHPTDKGIPKHMWDRTMNVRFNRQWAEEFVVGSLDPASRYITEIRAIAPYRMVQKDPIWLWKFLSKFEREGVLEYSKNHQIPFLWKDGNVPVVDNRKELEQDPGVIDWLES